MDLYIQRVQFGGRVFTAELAMPFRVFISVVLKLVGGTEPCKFYAGIHRTLC